MARLIESLYRSSRIFLRDQYVVSAKVEYREDGNILARKRLDEGEEDSG